MKNDTKLYVILKFIYDIKGPTQKEWYLATNCFEFIPSCGSNYQCSQPVSGFDLYID